MEFNQIIKKRRIELRKTLDDIAKECDVSKATVQRWESGEIKNVRRDKIAKLSLALDISPSTLMGWNNVIALDDISDLEIIINKYPNARKILSKFCRNSRIEKNLTEKYISEKANISLQEYLNFETSDTDIETKHIALILNALNISIDEAIGFIKGVEFGFSPRIMSFIESIDNFDAEDLNKVKELLMDEYKHKS